MYLSGKVHGPVAVVVSLHPRLAALSPLPCSMYTLVKEWKLNLISRKWANHSSLRIEIIITLPLRHVLEQEMLSKWG